MSDRRNVLVVEVGEDTYTEIASVLSREDISVDRFPTAATALELVTMVGFTAIIVHHPPKTIPLEEFLAQAKAEESASRDALVGVLISSKRPADDLKKTPDGVDVVIGPYGGQEARDQQLCKLLGIAPRAAVRVKVNTAVTIVDAQGDRYTAQTKDLSTSGVFAITDRLTPIDGVVRVVFQFPGDQTPFVADAQVARHGETESGEAQGMGLRFVSFQDGHLVRLGRYLESLYG